MLRAKQVACARLRRDGAEVLAIGLERAFAIINSRRVRRPTTRAPRGGGGLVEWAREPVGAQMNS